MEVREKLSSIFNGFKVLEDRGVDCVHVAHVKNLTC